MEGEEFDSELRKMSFYRKEGHCFGVLILHDGIEVARARIDLISNLPPPNCVKDVRSFVGIQDFIDDLSNIVVKLLSP